MGSFRWLIQPFLSNLPLAPPRLCFPHPGRAYKFQDVPDYQRKCHWPLTSAEGIEALATWVWHGPGAKITKSWTASDVKEGDSIVVRRYSMAVPLVFSFIEETWRGATAPGSRVRSTPHQRPFLASCQLHSAVCCVDVRALCRMPSQQVRGQGGHKEFW